MIEKELLSYLKNEMLKAEARALGAKSAYQETYLKQIRQILSDKGIYPNTDIEVTFLEGTFKYLYKEVSFDYWGDDVWILGVRYLKSGKLAKEGRQRICTIDNLNNIVRSK